jgi:ABC-type transport system substrate-binding protein
MSVNMVGTGPYVLPNPYNPAGTGYTEVPDPNYWGAGAAAAEPWNNILQPAKASVKINFQGQPALNVQDLRTGAVAAASFAYIGPSTITQLQNTPCVIVNALPLVYGATAGSWFIYMNQNTPPFNNLSVRKAVVHAIDYPGIIDAAFGGYASRWVGPVPPSYPYYNPQNLRPHEYNLTLARQFMANSPWPTGYPGTLNYEYVNLGDWAGVASILRSNLLAIGITINPVPITLDQLYEEQKIDPATGRCTTELAVNGGPFPIGQEFYTSDYIAPDDWTQNIAISWGSANQCMAHYADPVMDGLVIRAAGESDNATLTSYYSQMTRMMYDNYTVAWLVVPTTFQVYSPLLQGIIPNPMGTAHPLVMMFNTEYA